MQTPVKIVNLEMNVSQACNLKYEYCSHFGRYMQGIIPQDDLSYWYKSWNQKILPVNVRIMGGEPLLHPELVEIIRMTRNDWINSSVELIINRLLIPKMKETLFFTIREKTSKSPFRGMTSIRDQACPQCSICPERFEYADMCQKFNIFGLSQFKKTFCGEYHELP